MLHRRLNHAAAATATNDVYSLPLYAFHLFGHQLIEPFTRMYGRGQEEVMVS